MNKEILKIKERYEKHLLGLEGVTGVGLNGSIIIYVEKLTPELRTLIPRQIEGVPVRVKETGKIRLLALRPMAAIYADRTERWRPAPGGVSVGHPKVTAGTLGCRGICKKTGMLVGLSNNHVVALDWGTLHVGEIGDSTLQPGPVDGGVEPDDKIGELMRWVPVELDKNNLIDAAVFGSGELRRDVLEIGKPSNTVEPMVGVNVFKSGRTSGVKYGKITDVNATVKVEGQGICTFIDQVIVEPGFMQPGDSGSWVGEVETFNTIGLGHAAAENSTLSVVCKGIHIEELLDIEIIPPVPSISLASMLGLWLSSTSIFAAVYYGSGGGL